MAVVCFDCIPQEQRKELEILLSGSGHEIISITMQQMASFAGNMLELMNNEGRFFWVMSDQAFDSLLPDQINLLQSKSSILHVPLTVIETAGGGSARCMLAEVF
jgi:hypothetical protein